MDLSVFVETLSGIHELTSKVVSFNMSLSLCNATGNATVTLADEGLPIDIRTYDPITVYRSGVLNQTFLISNINREKPSHTLTLSCEASTKQLSDYWIDSSLSPTTPITTTRYWINEILSRTGVDYSFLTASDGEYVQKDAEMGYMDAKSALMPLLSQSGWYMTFGPDGTIYIGKIAVDADSALSLSDTEILDLQVVDHDKMYRNRAVVWGKANPITSGWVFADLTRHTAIDYDSLDLRTVVVANHLISENSTARAIAKRLLDEFARAEHVITVATDGFANVVLANKVTINSDYEKFTGIITTYNYTIDNAGEITTLVLNERCPRIIGAFDIDGYVYIGTTEDGVWRKPLQYIHTWSDYSQGLVDLNVSDLSIANGVFATVAGEVLYSRYEGDGAWSPITMANFPENSGIFPFSSGTAVACSVDQTNGDIYGLYTLKSFAYMDGFLTTATGISMSGSTNRSWLYVKKPGAGVMYPITYSGADFIGYDVERADGLTVITGVGLVAEVVSPDTEYNKTYISSRDTESVGQEHDLFQHYYEGTTTNQKSFTSFKMTMCTFGKYSFGTFKSGSTTFIKRYNTLSNALSTLTLSTNTNYVIINIGVINKDTLVVQYSTAFNQVGFQLVKFDLSTVTGIFDKTYTYFTTSVTITGTGNLIDDGVTDFANSYYCGAISGVHPTGGAFDPVVKEVYALYFEYASSGGTVTEHLLISRTSDRESSNSINLQVLPTDGHTFMVIYQYPPDLLSDNAIMRVDHVSDNGVGIQEALTITDSHSFGTFMANSNPAERKMFVYIWQSSGLTGYGVASLHIYSYSFDGGFTELASYPTFTSFSSDRWMATGPIANYLVIDKKVFELTTGVPQVGTWTLEPIEMCSVSDSINGAIYSLDVNGKLARWQPGDINDIITTASNHFTSFIALGVNRFIIGNINSSNTTYIYYLHPFPTDSDAGEPSGVIPSGGSGNSYVVITTIDNINFTLMGTSPIQSKVEISKSNPYVLYGGNNFNSGSVSSGVLPSGLAYNYGNLQLENLTNSPFFFPLIGRNPNFNYLITDSRVFDIVQPSGISRCVAICQNNTISGYTALGLLDTSYYMNGRATTTESGILYSGMIITENYSFQYLDISRWHTFSGVITHFETSNTQDVPYMFVSVSGNVFYQKDPTAMGEIEEPFVQRMTNIPDSVITIIRVDDSI